jgi:hypothetical protein
MKICSMPLLIVLLTSTIILFHRGLKPVFITKVMYGLVLLKSTACNS